MNDPATPPENRLRSTADAERPQERLERHGAGALSDTELLAMLLRSGTQGMDVLSLSAKLVHAAGSLAGLIHWKETDFRKFKGIGKIKALQLVTVMEIARRVVLQEKEEQPLLTTATDVVAYFQTKTQGLTVEKFYTLCLNRKNRLIRCIEISSGTATAALAHPREVFREVIRESASGAICVHNHPSGDPTPSAADVQITRQLREAARTLDLTLVDHIIIGRPGADPAGKGYFSFRETGVL